MKKTPFLFVIFTALSVFAGGVNDGLVFSLDFSAGDTNGDGDADKEEIVDAMTRFAATPRIPSRVRTISGTAADDAYVPISIQTMDVTSPYRNTTSSRPCLYFSQKTASINGVNQRSAQSVQYDACPVTGACTVFTRFKWDGAVAKGQPNHFIALNGYDYSNDKGWGLMLYRQYSSSTTDAWPAIMIGKISKKTPDLQDSDFKIVAGGWYDLICTMAPKDSSSTLVSFYLCKAGSNNSPVYSAQIEVAKKLTVNESNTFHLGCELKATSSAWIASTSETNYKKAANAFKGSIADFKIWNRVLSESEVKVLLDGADGQMWTIGACNNSADELNSQTTKNTFNTDSDSWADFPSSLDANRNEITISTPLTADQEDLPYILSIDSILSGDTAESTPVDILANNKKVKEIDLAAKTHHEIRIPRYFVRNTTDGRLSITIRRATENGTIKFDALSLAGSFQIGKIDDNNKEFTPSNEMRLLGVAGDKNNKHFVDALWYTRTSETDGTNKSQYRNAYVVAYISEETARAPALFQTSINCGSASKTHTIGFFVNGERKATWIGSGVDQYEQFSYAFEPNELPTGFVTFTFTDESNLPNISGNQWAYIDYLRFDARGFPEQTIILIR